MYFYMPLFLFKYLTSDYFQYQNSILMITQIIQLQFQNQSYHCSQANYTMLLIS